MVELLAGENEGDLGTHFWDYGDDKPALDCFQLHIVIVLTFDHVVQHTIIILPCLEGKLVLG